MGKTFFEKRVNNLKRLGRLLQLAPFVKAVILTGSMTTGATEKSSDIDLLIIAKPDRLYTARFFVTILSSLTGKRRKPNDKNPAGKFCLNYYLSADNLDIRPYTQRCANFHRYIISIWDAPGVYGEILRQNFWMLKFNVTIKNQNQVTLLNKTFPIKILAILSAIQKIKELIFVGRFGDFIERKMYSWQKRRIIGSEIYKNNHSSIVVLKSEIRLHPKKSL